MACSNSSLRCDVSIPEGGVEHALTLSNEWGQAVPNLAVMAPEAWTTERTLGPDFEVFHLVEPVGEDSLAARIGFYLGTAPDLRWYQAATERSPGCVADRHVEWHTGQDSDAPGMWLSETILEPFADLDLPEPESWLEIHAWVMAKDSTRLRDLRRWAGTLSIQPR